MNNLPRLTTQFFLLLMAATLVGCSQGEKKAMFTDTDKSEFKVGQVWNYQTRTNEVGSTLVILKVETGPGWKTIVHVGIAGLNIKTPKGTQDVVPHMPFDEPAVKKSVTTKIADNGMLIFKRVTDFGAMQPVRERAVYSQSLSRRLLRRLKRV